MNTMINTPIINNSSYEGMPFLHDDATYYHQQQEEEEVKPYQQGDDFRPTFYNPFEIKHRRRTSRAQFKVLEKTFLENPKPNASIRRWLAQKLVMTPRGVQVWFQNRRAKEKTVNSAKKSPLLVHSIIPNTQSTQSTLSLSEPLIKQLSNESNFDFMEQSPTMTCSPTIQSTASGCSCNDCQLFVPTPMTRTLSYPPFYQSDACSTNADEEELLMTPVTPFVDTGLQQTMYDYPMFLNSQWQEDNKPEEYNYYTPQQMRRNMYTDTMLFEDTTPRRYSQPTTADRFMQSTEVNFF